MTVAQVDTKVEPRVRVSGLSKHYGAVQALKSADFELLPGEVMALVGENGAGKSTFVKILCGFVRRDSGTVEVDGVPVGLDSPHQAEQAGIAVVQQELSVVGTLSVAENVFLGRPNAARFYTRGSSRNARRRTSRLSVLATSTRTGRPTRFRWQNVSSSRSHGWPLVTRRSSCWTSRRPRSRTTTSTA